MDAITIEKQSQTEYTVYTDEICLGTYFLGFGLVLISSEGSAVSLDMLEKAIEKLRELEKERAE